MKIQISNHLFSLIFISVFIFTGCTQEKEESVILTEGVLFLSGERVRLSGRIYSNGGSDVSEHGFEISTSESFTNPILIQNGVKSTLGAFIGETAQLNSDIDYYYRAFAIINDVFIYGNVKSFLTLKPTIISYSPQSASVDEIVRITGTNFSSNTRVFFGNEEAVIVNIELESIMDVKVPGIEGDTEVVLKIIDNASELVFENTFQFIYGTWTTPKETEISNSYRFNEPISFSKENKFVFGLGRNLVDGTLNNTLWEYNIVSELWKQLEFNGAGSIGAFYNNGGYFGSGYLGWDNSFATNPILAFEFWQYKNGAINYMGELPFNLYKSVSFYVEGVVHVLGGKSPYDISYLHYEYSEISNSWVRVADIPIIVNQKLPHFIFNNSLYFITKQGGFWSFNLAANEWEQLDQVPFVVEEGGISQVIDGKAYIGLFSFDNRIWEYDIVNNSWKQKSNISDNKSNFNAGSYALNSRIGVVRLNASGSDSNWIQTWEFEPEGF